MKRSFLSRCITICAACILSTSSVYAVSTPKTKEKHFYQKNMPLGGLAPAKVQGSDSWDIALSGSFLFWNVMQENMGIASMQTADTPPSAITAYQKTEFHPGFTASITTSLGTDHWMGKGKYTRLHTRTDSSTAPPPGGSMVVNPGFTSPGAVNQTASFVISSFQLDLDQIDLCLMRPSYFSSRLIFTPFVGPKFGFIDQKLRTEVTLVGSTEELPTQFTTDTWFIGPRFGFSLDWLIGYGFSSTSSFGASLIYQSQRVRGDLYDTTDVTDNSLDLLQYYRFFKPNWQMSLGAAWNSKTLGDAVCIKLFASYEIEYFSGQNVAKAAALENFFTNTQTDNISILLGDLVFHGLKTGLQFDF